MPESSVLLGPRVIPLQSSCQYSLDQRSTSATLTYLHKPETSNAKTENGDTNGHTVSTRKHEELTEHDSQDVHRLPQTVSLISTRKNKNGDHTCGFFDGIAWTKEDEIPYGVTTFNVNSDGKGSIIRSVTDVVVPGQASGLVTGIIDSPETDGTEVDDEVDWNSIIDFGANAAAQKRSMDGTTDEADVQAVDRPEEEQSEHTVMSGGLGEK